MLQRHPQSGRLATRLTIQLLPAVIVSTVGVALLGGPAREPQPAPAAAQAMTVVQAEAVFTIIPRQTADSETERASDADSSRTKATAPRAAKPKTVTANPPPAQQQRRVAAAEPAIAAPAEPPAAPPTPQPAPPAAGGDNFIMTGWRHVTAAAERLSQHVQPPPEWFKRSPPPRPPAPIPGRNPVNVPL